MEHDSSQMKKVLQSRRGRGLDISVILGSPEDDKHTDLAPKPDHPLAIDQAAGVRGAEDPTSPIHEDLEKEHIEALEKLHDGDLMDGMSDHDKHDMSGREPRSLGERARQMMMMKMSKK